MSPQPEKDEDRSALSWETVLDAGATGTAVSSPAPVTPAPAPAVSSPAVDAPGDVEIEFTIPPLSMTPLSLDPLPPIPESSTPAPGAAPNQRDVLGDIHLEIPPLDGNAAPASPPVAAPSASMLPPAPAPPPAPAAKPVGMAPDDAPVFDMIDLHIAPLDTAQPAPSTASSSVSSTRVVPTPPVTPAATPALVEQADPAPPPAAPLPVEAAPAPVPAPPAPAPAPASVSAPPAPAPTPVPAPAPVPAPPVSAPPVSAPVSEPPPAPVAQHVAEPVADAAPSPAAAPAAVDGLPNDPVSPDATPTTVIDSIVAAPAVPAVQAEVQGIDTGAHVAVARAAAPIVAVQYQPNQALVPTIAPTPSKALAQEPAQVSRKERKHDQKLKKLQQKQALREVKAKAKRPRSGGGGIALFFTLVVLAGLIAGAVVFGKPYLFPDEWDEASLPYREAVEVVRGTGISEPLLVQRQLAPVFAGPMSDNVVGPWEDDMATWRSLGLVSGVVDADLLHTLTADWTAAYYSPATGEIIANDSAPPGLLNAAIAEAMAAGALDQESEWSASIDESQLDASALTRADVIAASRTIGAATSFGPADVSTRDIGVSTFLPPVLEFRVNAPTHYAEFASDNAGALNAVAKSVQLQAAGDPELAAGDVLGASQQVMDRTYWYLVFASYTDATTAYSASNALVQASLATADNVGTQCSYATFSGSDVAGTAQISSVLQQWAATAPAAMNASVSTLSNGTMQLRSCDPGVGAESGARFGIGREIARFRSIELAAASSVPNTSTAPDLGAAISQVRAVLAVSDLPAVDFGATPAESAAQARAIAASLATGE